MCYYTDVINQLAIHQEVQQDCGLLGHVAAAIKPASNLKRLPSS